MARNSTIEWTNHTWNPWRGCHKVSTGCKNCYMFREQKKYGNEPNQVIRCRRATFNAPLRWKEPARVFVCSWSDFFIKEADQWRSEAWSVIRQTPHLTYQILTKRVDNIADRLPTDWGDGWPNVWLMTSAEDQGWLDERVSWLAPIPAALHGVSLEPLLGPIDLWPYLDPQHFEPIYYSKPNPTLSWCIIGGESDRSNPRPVKLDWIRNLIDQCKNAAVPVFVKQLGTAWARQNGARDWKGADPSEWPEELRVREFPERT